MFTRARMAMWGAEFLGTALLVMMALILLNTTAVSYFVATSVAVTLGLIVLLFSGISGAHVNPAITFGLWTARRIATIQAIGYIVAQMLGALASWKLYEYLSHNPVAAKSVTFSTSVLLAEVVGTFVLAMGIAAALVRGFELLQAALTIGGAFFTGIMLAAVASAGLLNPAVALGVRSWSTVYVLGPVVGAVVGINLYMFLFAQSVAKPKRK